MTETSRRALILLVASTLGAAPAAPDVVFLEGGGRVEGVVVERTDSRVVIETGPGRVSLPASRVVRVVESRSALEVFHERAASLAPGDRDGWADLARWAAAHELVTPSREAWRRVLAADPAHPEANAALGRVEMDGTWMSEDEAYRAQGYVRFEESWVTPAEHEALVREREAERAGALEQREAELRVREAEARAREAEARAREAEAAAEGSPADGGIPLWWGWGGGGYFPPVGPWPNEPGTSHPPAGRPRPHPPRAGASSQPSQPSHASPPRATPRPQPGAIAPPAPRVPEKH